MIILNSENIKIHNAPFSEFKSQNNSNDYESGFSTMLKSILDIPQENRPPDDGPIMDVQRQNDLISVQKNESLYHDEADKYGSDLSQRTEDAAYTDQKNRESDVNERRVEKNQQADSDNHEVKTKNVKDEKPDINAENTSHHMNAKNLRQESVHDELQTMLNQLLASRSINADMKKQLTETVHELASELKREPNAGKNTQIAVDKMKKLLAMFEKKTDASKQQSALPLELVKKINLLLDRIKNANTKTQNSENIKASILAAENGELKDKPDLTQNKITAFDTSGQLKNEPMSDTKAGFSFQSTGGHENNTRSVSRGSAAPLPQGSAFQEQLQSLLDKAKINIKDGQNGNVSINLYPKQLGSVSVNLGLEQGVISGRFFVENNEIKELLINNFENIRQQLEESGITVGDFQVNVRGQNKEQEAKEILNYNGNISENKDVTAVYESNLQSFHEGSINMIA